MTRTLAYKFRLRPRRGQERRLQQFCEAARYAWNHCLREYENALDEVRAAQRPLPGTIPAPAPSEMMAPSKPRQGVRVREGKRSKRSQLAPPVAVSDVGTPTDFIRLRSSPRALLEARMVDLGLQIGRRGDKTRTASLQSIMYKLWCHHRDTDAPEWVHAATKASLGGHSHVASYPVQRLCATIDKWMKARRRGPWITASERAAGRRKGKRSKDRGSDGLTVGAPRYKRAGVNPSFTIQAQKGKASHDRTAIRIPVVGRVYVDDRKDQSPTDKIPEGAVAKLVTVRQVAGAWDASVCVQEPWQVPPPSHRPACGIDLGLNAEATIAWSDGRVERVAPPRPMQTLGIGIVLLQRKLSYSKQVRRCMACGHETDVGERLKAFRQCPQIVGGAVCGGRVRKWRSKRGMALKRRLARLHAHVARVRAGHLHRLTHRLIREASTICTEPHNVTGLVSEGVARRCAELEYKGIRRREIRKAMLDIGWGELRRQVAYKGKWHGVDYVTLPAGTASDKTCWNCGHRNAVRPDTSDYACEECHWAGTRQENTALLCLGHVYEIPGGDPRRPGGDPAAGRKGGTSGRSRASSSRSTDRRGPGVNGRMGTDTTPGASAPGGSRKNARKMGGSPPPGVRAHSASTTPRHAPSRRPQEEPSQQ